jgi:hypothetical protein
LFSRPQLFSPKSKYCIHGGFPEIDRAVFGVERGVGILHFEVALGCPILTYELAED